ncbi:lauroyl-KDO2-lipid IV(A) myristoyltransferase [Ectothiorhodospira magna]|uniref:Lauroyl-KDO2-lipid IV(A) myristoyltransferase n=1 Tax=Ectothiorhodospira magna TaxID=867345 RepID=A0A1H9FI65_9GAMM|nr:lipid A biosynthesis acyltransferase [Ectothiorhodospira magna]SEQ37604.1 lauroyl-KDO2-lipid IV(A) myristoyltransferase [Ectothiorhodospira magna]
MTEVTDTTGREHAPEGYLPPFRASMLHPRYWPTWLGIGLLWAVMGLPRPVALGLGRLVGWMAWRSGGKRRHFADVNLRLCFPDWDAARREQVLRDHFRIVGQCFVDYPLLWFGSRRRHRSCIRLVDEGGALPLLRAGRPVILCTAHAPALDFGGLRLSLEAEGVSFTKPMSNPVVEWINTRGRSRYGAAMFSRDQGLRPAIRHIRQGRGFYYLGDEDLGREHTVFAPFFGIPKATVPALGRLARITGATVIPTIGFYRRDQDRYELVMAPPLEDFPTGDDAVDAARMNAALEALIRRDPAQYLWTLRFFKTRPQGEPRVY